MSVRRLSRGPFVLCDSDGWARQVGRTACKRESWVGMLRMQRYLDDCLRAVLLATEQLLFLLVTLHNQDILMSNVPGRRPQKQQHPRRPHASANAHQAMAHAAPAAARPLSGRASPSFEAVGVEVRTIKCFPRMSKGQSQMSVRSLCK